MAPAVGVLALQGDFALHQARLEALGARAPKVRRPAELEACDGLVVPGGESTTFTKMLRETGLFDAVRTFAASRPVMGTCAGLIVLCTELRGDHMETLGLIEAVVERNAYGRQVDSFTGSVRAPALAGPELEGVFIRAPRILSLGPGVEAVGWHGDDVVMARNRRVLGLTFHPELTGDARVHRYFLDSFVSSP
jgi:5'-phosphate synthase pdxT subunit